MKTKSKTTKHSIKVTLNILTQPRLQHCNRQYSVTMFNQLGIPSLEATVAVAAAGTLSAPFGIYIIDKVHAMVEH